MPANPKPADARTRRKAAKQSTPSPGRGRGFAEHRSAPSEPAGCAKPAVGQGVGGKPVPSPQGVLHRLNLTVQYACNNDALPSRPLLRRWVKASCEHPLQATLRFVDAAEGRALNRDWRGKDHATNVLSFAYAVDPVVIGDLAICPPVVLREAAEQGKPVESHFAHLVVHGMLHLQGYDHQTDADAALMETREREILARLGIPDPY